MNGNRFDEIARLSAHGMSRRRILRAIVGTAIGGSAFRFIVPAPSAAASCPAGTTACQDPARGRVCCPGATCHPNNPHAVCCPGDQGFCCGRCVPWGPQVNAKNCTGAACTKGGGGSCPAGQGLCCGRCVPWGPNVTAAKCTGAACSPPKPTRTPTPKANTQGPGGTCALNSDCVSGKCCSPICVDADGCCSSAECGGGTCQNNKCVHDLCHGQVCDDPKICTVQACSLSTGACYDTRIAKPDGTPCSSGSSSCAKHVCFSGFPGGICTDYCARSVMCELNTVGGKVRYDCTEAVLSLPEQIFECTYAFILGKFKLILEGLNLAILDSTDAATTIVEETTARDNFEAIVAAISYVSPVPIACVTFLADRITGGEYTALELCLSNEACTTELKRTLGICGTKLCTAN